MSENHVMSIGGREYRAQVKELKADSALVVVDGVEYLVDLIQVGRKRVQAPEVVRSPVSRSIPIQVAPVAGAASPAPATPTGPTSSASFASPGSDSITAPMPGLIFQLKVKEGEVVRAGQTLLVLEAMKMENAIFAPCNGTVSKVYVREGDGVSEGDLLLDVARPQMTTL